MGLYPSAAGRITISSLFPDDSIRALMVEIAPTWSIDRNFQVRLEFLARDATRAIFRSPDEGRPVGSERFVWSRDGTMLLLVGRYFSNAPGPLRVTGEQANLLYHVPSGRGWCALDQQREWHPLTRDVLEKVVFMQVVPLRSA